MEIKRLQTLATEILKAINNISPSYLNNIFTLKANTKIRPRDIIVRHHNTATQQGTVFEVIIFEQINMNLSNYRGKNSFVSLRFCFVLLFLFDCILNIVPIALIALEAAIKRRKVL